LQLVYRREGTEIATIVPRGRRPMRRATIERRRPGGSINFLWMMAQTRGADRQSASSLAARVRARPQVWTRPMNWNSIAVETVEGIGRQMVTGDRLMMCRLQMAPHITPVLAPTRADHHHRTGRRTTSTGPIGSSRPADPALPSNVSPARRCWKPVVLIDIFRQSELVKDSNGGWGPAARRPLQIPLHDGRILRGFFVTVRRPEAVVKPIR
jgi:hypothetical protein